MINGVEFVELLTRTNAVPTKVIDRLRQQVTPGTDPRRIIDLLVERKLADRSRLEQLLGGTPDDDELELLPLDDDESDSDKNSAGTSSGTPLAGDDLLAEPAVVVPDLLEPLSGPTLLDDDAWPTPSSPLDDDPDEFPPAGRTPTSTRIGRRKIVSHWDSPLILWGGGSLIVLVALLVALMIFLNRGAGNDLVTQADQAYYDKNYPEAIRLYDRLASQHPRHPQASHARVKSRVARLRQAIEGDRNFPQALQLAQEVLPEIEKEPALDEAQNELASILPAIMQGLVNLADQADNMQETEEHINQVQEVMRLIDNPSYISAARRQDRQPVVDELLAKLETARRGVLQEQRLREVLEAIQNSSESGDFAAAHRAARELVRDYPTLAGNAELRNLWPRLSQLESERIRPLEEFPPVTTDEAADQRVRRVTLTYSSGTALTDVPEQTVIPMLVRGVAYGVQARTGQVVWRRFLGFNATVSPLNLGATQGGVLLVDARRDELLWCDAVSGQLRWRVACPSAPLTPAVHDNAVIVPCQDGQLLRLNLSDGRATHGVQVPLPLAGGCAVLGDSIFICAQYDSIYQLSARTLESQGALALGHAPGSIVVPPVTAGNRVAIGVNQSGGDSRLVLMPAMTDETPVAPESFDLPGRIVTPMSADGPRVLVVTDKGSMSLFEAGPAGGQQPPKQIVSASRPRPEQSMARGVMLGNLVWIVENQLRQFRAVVAQGRLADQGTVLPDVRLAGDPVTLGNYLFAPVRFTDAALISVMALRALENESARPAWRLDVNLTPLPPIITATDAAALEVVTSSGHWYRLTPDVVRSGRAEAPIAKLELPRHVTQLGAGQILDATRTIYPATRAGVGWALVTRGERPTLQWVQPVDRSAPALASAESSTPLPHVWRGGIVQARPDQIDWLDPATGKAKTKPLVPPIDIGQQSEWTQAVTAPDNPSQFLIANRGGQLYRIGLEEPDGATLRLAQQNELGLELFGPTAAGEKHVWMIAGPRHQPKVVAIQAADLSVAEQWDLAGPVSSGPIRVSDWIVMGDETGVIHIWSAANASHQEIRPGLGALVGRPVWSDNLLWMALMDGYIVAIDPRKGEVTSRFAAFEPLVEGPMLMAGHAMAIASDGTICVVELHGPDQ